MFGDGDDRLINAGNCVIRTNILASRCNVDRRK